MFRKEAEWVASTLEHLVRKDAGPILNLGSSDLEFRTQVQPWIDALIFAPLRARGIEIIHVDMREGEGIDIRADIMKPDDLARLSVYAPQIILCCNLLEHVENPQALAGACLKLLTPNGYVVVSVPLSYPYHRDPIDTNLRPTPEELAALFAQAGEKSDEKSEMIESVILKPGSWRDDVAKRPWILLRPLLRFPFPFLGFARWKRSMKRLYWLVFPYQVTCVIIAKHVVVADDRSR